MKVSICYLFLLGNKMWSLRSHLSDMGQSNGSVSGSRCEGFQRTATKIFADEGVF